MTAVDLDTELLALGTGAEPRPLSDWLTTFPMAPVVLDPYTAESARIIHTARRIMTSYKGADCRPCWILTCDADGARRFLGPWTEDTLTFVDTERSAVAALDLASLPAFMLIRQDGQVAAAAQSWDPQQWRTVAEAISSLAGWTRPLIGGHEDPPPYPGTPARP